MGKAGRSKDLPESLKRKAKIVGAEIAKKNCILVTGACMGTPDIAAKEASKRGGIVLGYSPAKNLKEHIEPPISYPQIPETMIPIFTGYGKIGRNVLSIFECDGVICVGGGVGTLNEFSIAYHEGKVIGVLEGVEGIAEYVMKAERYFKHTGACIIKDRNPKRLVERVIKEIEKREEKPRKEIPITFKNERGRNLVGIIHLPDKPKPPAVIICHGFQSTKSKRKPIRLARALREEGILAFRFDFEGCGDSEGEEIDITVKREVSDLNCAIKALFKECDVDSRRIALVGHSLGAVIAGLFIEKFKFPVRTLVFWAPGFQQKELFKLWHTKKDLEEMRKKGILIRGEKEVGRDYYLENKNKDYSFLFSRFKLPVLIIHGKKDEDVPLEFSEKIAQRHKNIHLEVLPRANHKFNDLSSQRRLIKTTTQWLKKYLIKK